MKINSNYAGFTNDVFMGKFSFFIVMDINGVDLAIKEILDKAQHFNHIVFTGDEPLLQKLEIVEFIRKLHKVNKDSVVRIETHGTIRPTEINNIENIMFMVQPLLKNSGVDARERISYTNFQWFAELGCNFKFLILNDDDIDEVGQIMTTIGLKKENTWFISNTNDRDTLLYIQKQARIKGVNFVPMLNIMLEEKDDHGDNSTDN